MIPKEYHLRKHIADIFSEPKIEILPLREHPIYPKEGTKPHYEGYRNYHYDNSYGEKDTENFKDKEKLSNKNK